jgi:epoxyqueuosine reductase
MKLGVRIKKLFYRRFMKPSIEKIYRKEEALTEKTGVITANNLSPVRFDIPLHIIDFVERGNKNNLMNRSTILPMLSNVRNINKSIDSLKKNENKKKVKIDDVFLKNLKEFCMDQGLASIGFTKLPRHLIFKHKAVLFENAIVLVMEMDKDRIALAPHRKTVKMIMQTYNKLGIAANKITVYLRKNGYAAQASHPLGGIVLYPPLAKDAGLGWLGRHGLLITPEFGPRVRLAAVFTNIVNLPDHSNNAHSWIKDYCATCGICIKKCPPSAIKEQAIQQKNGLITHIDGEICFPYFAQNYGCTICVKVCPFSTLSYDKLHKTTIKKGFN